MTRLAILSTALGCAIILGRLPLLLVPERAREWIRLFPRSKWAGRVIAAVDYVWVGVLLATTPLGWFDEWKMVLWVLVPIAYALTIEFVDELLAARALGGFALLLATPVLNAAQWHPSDARLVVTVLAYLWVVAGMVLVVSPYWLRKSAAFWIASNQRCRLGALLGMVVGAGLLALGLFVY